MNINELSEKNLRDAVQMYKLHTKDYFNYVHGSDFSDDDIADMLQDLDADGDFTYLFCDKGTTLAMLTVSKQRAEIINMFVNFSSCDEFFATKFLEFAIKQFSAITRVFIWVPSVHTSIQFMLEDYGFEYTGEQQYISKEHNLLKFKYVFKRKK